MYEVIYSSILTFFRKHCFLYWSDSELGSGSPEVREALWQLSVQTEKPIEKTLAISIQGDGGWSKG